MPIPDYQTLMLPLLKVAYVTQNFSRKEAVEILAKQFGLSEAEHTELLPNGSSIFYSRVGWARTYLKKAGLVDSPKRGSIVITPKGIDLLNTNPDKVDL